MTRRTGLTLIELIMAMMIVGLLASIAVPKFRDIRRRATATQIIGDFDAVKIATMNFYIDSTYYPAETNSGKIPDNLAPYLPVNFTMKRPGWTLDYENWVTTTGGKGKGKGWGWGKTKTTKTETIIGLSFSSPDSALARTAMRMMGGAAYTLGNKFTFIIQAF